MITVHFCVESFDPYRGGMEESALRLVTVLANDRSVRFVGYVISVPVVRGGTIGVGKVVDIASEVDKLIAPLGPRTLANSRERGQEKTRLQILLMRQAVRRELARAPNDSHLLLSFYLSTAGFVCQHIACEFGLPHVACSRGSDLGRDLFTREGLASVEFVLRKASCIVTTNLEHARYVKQNANRQEHVHTIYNAIPKHVRPTWKRTRGKQVQLVSVTGYSVKKGTHTLLKASARLLEEGLPIQLRIVGPVGTGHWKELRELFSKRYDGAISMGGQIGRDDVEEFLLSGDVFCSASLSEGCANATMLAVCLGMPVASTATGALADFVRDLKHVTTVEPGSLNDFTEMLRQVVTGLLDETLTIDLHQVAAISRRLSWKREIVEWKKIFCTYSTRFSSEGNL